MPKVAPQPGAPWEIVLTPASGRQAAVTMVFRWIPAGEFVMGSRGYQNDEEPRHRVRITRGFWLAETPVTQAQFAAWKPEHRNGFEGPSCPAERVSWFLAAEFCGWLTTRLEDGTGMWAATLPTEAQWEYACRAGVVGSEYCDGDGEGALLEVGWFDGNSANQTHPVKEKPPNAWNLYDLHGNVLEWCADEYRPEAYRERADGAEDPGSEDQRLVLEGRAASVPKDRDRVLRGGSWFDSAVRCRAAVSRQVGAGCRLRHRLPRLPPVSGPQVWWSIQPARREGRSRRRETERRGTRSGVGRSRRRPAASKSKAARGRVG